MPRKIARFGWNPDIPDPRDHAYQVAPTQTQVLPAKVDLTSKCPPVYQQGSLGSCVGNSIGALMAFHIRKDQNQRLFLPSRLFVYYNARSFEGTTRVDAGAQLRDGIKGVVQYGVPDEKLWRYSEANPGAFQRKPTKAAYKAALQNVASSYQRLPRTLNAFRACLASGNPFVFGFTVFESFDSGDVAKNGILGLPSANEAVLGGHAVMAVGYDDAAQRLIVRNSWGATWGKHGYFTMPYAYLLDSNLSDDFWTVRAVT